MNFNRSSAHARQLFGRVLGSCLIFAAAAINAQALDQVELELNRNLWNSHNISNYDIVESVGCFCQPPFGQLAIVSVRLDTIVSVTDVQTHEPVIPFDYLTIDGMFHRLQSALNSGQDLWIDAEFDSQLGYPRFFRIDDPLIGDDDLTFRVRDFTIVPEPAAFVLSLMTLVALTARFRGLGARAK